MPKVKLTQEQLEDIEMNRTSAMIPDDERYDEILKQAEDRP